MAETCVCKHAKSDHIYEGGACRPGFVCPTGCTEYVPDGATAMANNLVGYLTARAQRREERVDAMLAAMTPREQRLVREAAVMGFVHGKGFTGPEHPKDTPVMRGVLSACDAMPDLYPIMSSLTEPITAERVYNAWHARPLDEGWGGCADRDAIARVMALFSGESR